MVGMWNGTQHLLALFCFLSSRVANLRFCLLWLCFHFYFSMPRPCCLDLSCSLSYLFVLLSLHSPLSLLFRFSSLPPAVTASNYVLLISVYLLLLSLPPSHFFLFLTLSLSILLIITFFFFFLFHGTSFFLLPYLSLSLTILLPPSFVFSL